MRTPVLELRGQLATVGWLVAVLWLGVAAFAWWRLDQPWNWAVTAFAVLAAAGTAFVSRGLVVRVADAGVSGDGVPTVAWGDVEHVGVHPGWVSVPYLAVRRGRAIDELPLDGIAGFGRGPAVRLAQQVADAGGLGEVVVAAPTRSSGSPRRGVQG